MSIPVTCPHCKQQTYAAQIYGGMTGPCRNCGEPLQVRNQESRRRRYLSPLAAVAIILVVYVGGSQMLRLFMETGSACSWSSDIQRWEDSGAKLRRIGMALRSYHRDFGQFPPAGIQANGQPPDHSWRVRLLPYLGEEEAYAQYRLEEHWDSHHNLQVTIPQVFCLSSRTRLPSARTPFIAVTGEGTAWARAAEISPDELAQELARRPLVLEDNEVDMPWNSPADLDAATLLYAAPREDEPPPDGLLVNRHVRYLMLLREDSVCTEQLLTRPEWSAFLRGQDDPAFLE